MREHDGKHDGERNVACSRLRVLADLDETDDDLAPFREKEKERRFWKLRTHKISVAARESRALAGTDTAGGFR